MSALLKRLLKVERVLGPRPDPPAPPPPALTAALEAEWALWVPLLNAAESLVDEATDHDEAFDAALAELKDYVASRRDWVVTALSSYHRDPACVSPYGPPPEWFPPMTAEGMGHDYVEGQAWDLAARRRVPHALLLFLRTLPPEDRTVRPDELTIKRLPNGRQADERANPWLGQWIDNLAGLYSRLPPDVDPELLGRLVRRYRSGDAGYYSLNSHETVACNGCGLQRPITREEARGRPVSGACPHCGRDAGWTWCLFRRRDLDWQPLAAAELAAVAP
jgi:hypothetical protein